MTIKYPNGVVIEGPKEELRDIIDRLENPKRINGPNSTNTYDPDERGLYIKEVGEYRFPCYFF